MTGGADWIEWLILAAKVAVIFGGFLTSVPIMEWVERRGAAFLQNRLGPNRVGPFGLLQPIADAIKFFFKEDPIPASVHRFYYLLAPLVSVVPACMAFGVIPIAEPVTFLGRNIHFQIADLNVGLLYVFAVTGIGVYGIVMAGWASNSKYSLLGGLRSSSQMISYEISMALSVIGIILVFSSLHLGDITRAQGDVLFQFGSIAVPRWGIFVQPLGFIIFLTAMFAETNRLPFDLPEGETEIIAGFHIEYGSMKFLSFMLAEYTNMATAAAMIATLYFGGWQLLPGVGSLHGFVVQLMALGPAVELWSRVALQVLSFAVKTGFFLWLFVWVRWTLPRFRYDQLMDLGWKGLLPLSLLNIVGTAALMYWKVL